MKRYLARLFRGILEALIPVAIDRVREKIASGDLDEVIADVTVRVAKKQTP